MPSASLHSGLLLGTLAVLAGGGLAVAASAYTLSQDDPLGQGFTWSTGLNLASNAALIVLMFIYQQLGAEVDNPSLRKTSIGLALALLSFSVLGFADIEVLPEGWAIAALVVAALGAVAMVIWLFATPGAKKAPTPEEAATETSDKAKAGAGVGGLVIFALIAVKIGARFLLRKGMGLDDYTVIALVVVSLLALIYLIWFGVALIRLRHKLGVLAYLLGLFSILMPLVLVAAATAYTVAIIGLEQPGMDEKQMEKAVEDLTKDWVRTGIVVQMVLLVIWTLLTAFFLVALRNRYEPDWTAQPPSDPVV